jgi:acyl-CoA reductase-like NAD-dependent aldehyde dehydrogenase
MEKKLDTTNTTIRELTPAGSGHEGLAASIAGERIDVEALTAWVADHDWSLLIGGTLRHAVGDAVYDDPSPVLGGVIAQVPDAGAADVADAVRLAELAAPEWAATRVAERSRIVLEMARRLRAHAAEFAALDTLDGGNILRLTREDVTGGAETMEFFAAAGVALTGQVIPASSGNLHYTLQQPYPVVARIIPYNHPIRFLSGKISAPLMAGAPIIMKAPHQTPLSALFFAELVRDLVPAGVLSIITGAGPATGNALVQHPRVRRIAFTGSAPTGLKIQQSAAQVGVKHVSLELGGKNALIAFADADPKEIARGAVRGMNFSWSGQSCGSTSRLLIHRSILDATLAELTSIVIGMKLGDPFDPASDVGTLVSQDQYDKVMRYLQIAKDEGARVLVGGGPVTADGREDALLIAPTVLVDVDPSMRIAREEIFGPVTSVIPFDTEEEAIAIANSVDYGLTSSIWTNDLKRAHRVAAAVEAGYVWINTSSTHFIGTPFGGTKSSGLGREETIEELYSYTETKAVHVAL